MVISDCASDFAKAGPVLAGHYVRELQDAGASEPVFMLTLVHARTVRPPQDTVRALNTPGEGATLPDKDNDVASSSGRRPFSRICSGLYHGHGRRHL
jgi:hypothetical protein